MTWPRSGLGLRDMTAVTGAFAVTAAAICCFPLSRGTTLRNLWEWLDRRAAKNLRTVLGVAGEYSRLQP